MSPPKLLAELRGRGVRVAIEGDELKLRGSAQVLKPQVLETVRRLKPALLELLLLEEAKAAPQVKAEPTVQVLAGPASTCTASGELTRHERRAVELAHQRGHTAGGWPLEVFVDEIWRRNNPPEDEPDAPQVLAVQSATSGRQKENR